MIKKLKNLKKSSNVANRFIETVHIANQGIMRKQDDKTVDLMPIVREAMLKKKE